MMSSITERAVAYVQASYPDARVEWRCGPIKRKISLADIVRDMMPALKIDFYPVSDNPDALPGKMLLVCRVCGRLARTETVELVDVTRSWKAIEYECGSAERHKCLVLI